MSWDNFAYCGYILILCYKKLLSLNRFEGLNSVLWILGSQMLILLIYVHFKIMLLDEFTTKLLASCCKMTDLLAEGITGKCYKYLSWKSLFIMIERVWNSSKF